MRFGLFHTAQWPETTEQKAQIEKSLREVLVAEELGFESAFLTEHHFSRHGLTSSNLALLSYLAAKTSTIRLGTAVAVIPFHNPVRLAEEAAMVDVLSNGRLEMGVGRGFQWVEYNGFGIAMDESVERYEEGMEVLLRCWTEPGRFSHAGKHWRFDDISAEPKPLQKPHPPISVAATSHESIQKAARSGFKLQLSQGLPPDQIPALVGVYRAAVEESGRVFDPSNVILARTLYLAESKERAWEEAGPQFDWFRQTGARMRAPSSDDPHAPTNLFALNGTSVERDETPIFDSPDGCAERLAAFEACGVGQVLFFLNAAATPFEGAVRTMQLFTKEVQPHFRRPVAV